MRNWAQVMENVSLFSQFEHKIAMPHLQNNNLKKKKKEKKKAQGMVLIHYDIKAGWTDKQNEASSALFTWFLCWLKALLA